MKKFLSLVLALVMTMSLVTVGAGATSFTDDSSVDYDEAITVMNAIKVIGGYSDGTFRPDAVLTRGAASKIICNMLMGTTASDALSVSSAPFSDVPADSTFAGYIAYMAKEGIVSGYSDGTFRPGANLTGYAFMKMLLVALGYDAKNEGYTGANWSVSVAKRALNLGLTKGLDETFNGLKPVTRQEACLYAFRTLQADLVEYTDGMTVNSSGVTITSNAKLRNATKLASDKVTNIDTTKADTVQFAERYFTKLIKQGSSDDFGRSATKWIYEGKSIGKFKSDAVATFTSKTDTKDIVSALLTYRFANASVYYNVTDDAKIITPTNTNSAQQDLGLNAPGTTGKLYVNGSNSTTTYNKPTASDGALTIAGWLKWMTKTNNARVEVFADEYDLINRIVVTQYSVGKVTKVSTASNGDVTYTIECKQGTNKGNIVKGIDYNANSNSDDTISVTGSVAKDDIVTYVEFSNMLYVYPTTSVTGTISKTDTSDKLITMSGTTYPYWTEFTVDATTETTLYIDQFGNVCYSDKTSNAALIAYVASAWNESSMGVPTYYAQIVNTKGEVSTIKTNDTWEGCTGSVVTYTVGNGKATVQTTPTASGMGTGSKVYGVADDHMTVAARLWAGASNSYYYVAGDTKVIYVKDKGADLKVNVTTGLMRVDKDLSGKGMSGYYFVTNDTDTNVDTVFIVGATGGVNTDTLLFSKKPSTATVSGSDGNKYFSQDLYKNGNKENYTVESAGDTGFFTYAVNETTGVYTLHPETSDIFYIYAVGRDTVKGDAMTARTAIKGNRYLEMYQANADSATHCTVDALNAEIYDLTGKTYSIDSIKELYDAADDTSADYVTLAVFATTTVNSATGLREAKQIYIMKYSDVKGTYTK